MGGANVSRAQSAKVMKPNESRTGAAHKQSTDEVMKMTAQVPQVQHFLGYLGRSLITQPRRN
jgi:hypothetical protein